ncbi:hypothetical protein F2Q69_00058448 [Brassica cretica]|uniref:MPN domain-containing protein n=1 Tax=Brassica cretica TaxID=69181 RepID=A0A8S9RPN3_BRACR|nr:hypothetical protein F2Q69_00058448 [Brassica cretica]
MLSMGNSFRQQFVDSKPMITNGSNNEPEKPIVESSSTPSESIQKNYTEELSSMISFEEEESVNDNNIIRQPSPPPVLAEVQDLAHGLCHEANEVECNIDNSLPDESLRAESPLELHIATTMMDAFMRLANSNTKKDLETCGILAGSLKNRKFYITALIIPKQESTSNSCQATNEEEIFEVQDKQSLFPLGWIHVSFNLPPLGRYITMYFTKYVIEYLTKYVTEYVNTRRIQHIPTSTSHQRTAWSPHLNGHTKTLDHPSTHKAHKSYTRWLTPPHKAPTPTPPN